MNESGYHLNTMKVKFVQIGDELDAEQALKELVKGDNEVRRLSRTTTSISKVHSRKSRVCCNTKAV